MTDYDTAPIMALHAAMSEMRRWILSCDDQREKSARLAKLAAMARRGEITPDEGRRAIEEINRITPKVYDGGNLEIAIRAVLAEIPALTAARAENDRLTRERDAARKALEPFSDVAGQLFGANYNDNDCVLALNLPYDGPVKPDLRFRDFRRARNVLADGYLPPLPSR
jgi:hypothetical protein